MRDRGPPVLQCMRFFYPCITAIRDLSEHVIDQGAIVAAYRPWSRLFRLQRFISAGYNSHYHDGRCRSKASCVAANFEAWFTIVSCNTPINAGPSGNASAAIDALSGSGDAYDLGDSFRKPGCFSCFGSSH